MNDFQKGLFSNLDGLQYDNFASNSTSGPALGKRPKATTVQSSLVGGLDSSILIDPRRLHMTLGVMALEQDDSSVVSSHRPLTQSQPLLSPAPPLTTPLGYSTKKTVSTALDLLKSLKPRISEILDCDKGVEIPLEVMHVLKTEKMWMNTKKRRREAGDKKEGGSRGGERNKGDEDGGRDNPEIARNDVKEEEKETVGAGVLYVAPDIKNESGTADLHKLIQVSGGSETHF